MTGEVRSDRCRLDDLFTAVEVGEAPRAGLRRACGWARSWRVELRMGGARSESAVADLGGIAAGEMSPVRAFAWSTRQRHRPGLQFMVCTGRHHGFESLEEQRLLLALDFIGLARGVVWQPLRLGFDTADGRRSHVPAFLGSDAEGGCVVDVRTGRQWAWRSCGAAYVLEAESGVRGGSVLEAAHGEPRAQSDPATTRVGARRRAKAAELRALGGQAALLGLAHVSVRTLERFAAAYARDGVLGLIDRRWVPRGGQRPSLSPAVLEALEAVHAETLHRSRVSMRTRDRLV